MKVKVVQIVWHNKEPIFSVDFHPSGVLASGGADSEIKLWRLTDSEEGKLDVEFVSSITGDKFESGLKTWNCIRFCPTGQSLAAVGDCGQIQIWKSTAPDWTTTSLQNASWKSTNCGAYSPEDVVDLCWAADGSGFITASNDMTCMAWDPEAKAVKAKMRLEGHRLYVQGVAWDPLQQAIVTQSADRSCRVFSMRQAVPGLKKKGPAGPKTAIARIADHYPSHVINKCTFTSQRHAGEPEQGKKIAQSLFHDDSLNSFFRRLAFSPDGSMLVVPAGMQKLSDKASINTAYVFAKGSWATPLLSLPVGPKPAVAVRFCPVLFQLKSKEELALEKALPPIDLPYRLVFAIATKDSVIIYETQGLQPLVILGGLHLEIITDLAWSADGRTLVISSYDGYCSIAHFEEGELGKPVSMDLVPPHVKSQLWATVAAKHREEPMSQPSIQKSTPLQQVSSETQPKPTEACVSIQNLPGPKQPQNLQSRPSSLMAGLGSRPDQPGLSSSAASKTGSLADLVGKHGLTNSSHSSQPGFKRARRIAPIAIHGEAPVKKPEQGQSHTQAIPSDRLTPKTSDLPAAQRTNCSAPSTTQAPDTRSEEAGGQRIHHGPVLASTPEHAQKQAAAVIDLSESDDDQPQALAESSKEHKKLAQTSQEGEGSGRAAAVNQSTSEVQASHATPQCAQHEAQLLSKTTKSQSHVGSELECAHAQQGRVESDCKSPVQSLELQAAGLSIAELAAAAGCEAAQDASK